MRAALALLALALPAAALDLPPGAVLTGSEQESPGSYAVPTGPWTAGGLPTVLAEGAVTQEAWQVTDAGTTLELLAPLRDQLLADRWEVIFSCDTADCGGFDFRYATQVLPEPAMHVDLGDFRFLAARRPAGTGMEYATVLTSARGGLGFVQVSRVGAPGVPDLSRADLATKTPLAARPDLLAADPETAADPDLIRALTTRGRAVLEGVAFETGSARLAQGAPEVLALLADWLKADPARKVTLVGHTDAEGTLDGNLSLSRARARAVADRLVQDLGVAPGQVGAEGVGFLMPLAPNDSDGNRALNRRVEAVLLHP